MIELTSGLNEEQAQAVLSDSKRILMLAGAGTGKCLVGDTLINTDRGLLKIESIPDHYPVNYIDECQAEVRTVDINGQRAFNTATSHFYNMGEGITVKIATSQGYTVEGTPEHPVIVLNHDGDLQFKKLQSINPNDVVAICKKIDLWGNNTEISEEMAYVIGLLLGDGYLAAAKNTISFTKEDDHLGMIYSDLIEKLFDVRVTKQSHKLKATSWWFCNKSARQRLVDLGLSMTTAESKSIPQKIMESPKRVVVECLRGLFDTDGGMYAPRRRFEYCTKSKVMATQIQLLLLNLGIVCRLKERRMIGYPHTYYYIYVAGSFLKKFKNEVGFKHVEYKNNKLELACDVENNDNINLIYSQQKRFRSIAKQSVGRSYYDGHSQRIINEEGFINIRDYMRGRRNPTPNAISKIVGAVDIEIPELNYLTFLGDTFFFDKVSSISEGSAVVYDFTVPGTHCFVSNGIVSHNTKTLTHRLAHLNLNCRVGTSSILAITFTRAAAKEMKDRLGPLIGVKEARKLTCCTFHSLAVRILKEWGHRLGLDKNFTIYDQADREEIIKSILLTLGMSGKTSVSKVMDQMSRANPREPEASVLREYGWQLKRYNAVDLDHLIRKVNELFIRHPDVAAYYSRQWKYVFVDEFQDTDREQLQFIKMLNPENLFVIGDDFQAIYGWRGARVENILEFPNEFPGTETIKLERNYRSTMPIIEAANLLIKHNVNQTEKKLIAHKDGHPFDLLILSSQESEADMISELIEQRPFGEKYSDYAILARTNAQVEFVYHKLRVKGIPCMILSGADDPLKNHDIRLLTSHLKSIFNPKDEKNFKRSVNFPEPMMTDMQMKQLEKCATEKSLSLREAVAVNEVFYGLYCFNSALSSRVLSTNTALGSYMVLVEGLGLRQWYEERNLHNRVQNLDDAERYIAYWMERQEKLGEEVDVQTFLRWLAIRDIQEKLIEDRDAVRLMTVHGSKGLEFPSVFLIGMNEGIFPSRNTRDMEEERRLAYVAVTRAKDNLIISSTRTATSWGKTEEYEPSRFITEMGGRVDC